MERQVSEANSGQRNKFDYFETDKLSDLLTDRRILKLDRFPTQSSQQPEKMLNFYNVCM